MKIKLTLLCLAVFIPVAMADQEQENRRLTLEDLRTFTDRITEVPCPRIAIAHRMALRMHVAHGCYSYA